MNFKNTDIYKSYGDYVLGGCSMEDLESITTPDSAGLVNEQKLRHIFHSRIEKSIQSYLDGVVSRLQSDGVKDAEGIAMAQLCDRIKDYCNINIQSDSVGEIADSISESDPYITWKSEMVENVRKAESATRFMGFANAQSASTTESEADVDCAISEPNFIEFLEFLAKYI